MITVAKPTKDPRKLSYLYPSMSLRRYKELTDNYYRQTCLHTAVQIAKLGGFIIVPCDVIHWRRKKSLADRHFDLFGHSYYVVRPDELTAKERQKIKEAYTD